MIKEAGLFIISAGFLVYFISPRDEQPKPQTPKIEAPQKTASSYDADADYWGDEADDDEGVEQEFVFGEPMTSTDPVSENDDSDAYDEDDDSSERKVASNSTAASDYEAPRAARTSPVNSNSPKPGELGSAENPIPLN